MVNQMMLNYLTWLRKSLYCGQKIGRILRVPRENLNEFGVNYRDDAYERAFQVLSCWRENSTDGAISRYQVLFDALTKIGRSDLAKKNCCY